MLAPASEPLCAHAEADRLPPAPPACAALLSLRPQVLSHFAGCYRALSKRAQAYEASGALVDAAEDYRAAAELAPAVRRAAAGAAVAGRAALAVLRPGGGARTHLSGSAAARPPALTHRPAPVPRCACA